MRRVSFRMLILIIVVGALIGSAVGEIANLLPVGVVKEFFLRSYANGFEPGTIDLKIFTLTLGFTFSLNIAGVIGIVIAVYVLRWYK